jgi:phage pi2 protein 07
MYEEPRAPLVIRIEDSGVVYISRTIFNTYLVTEKKANLIEFKNGIKETGIELFEKRIRMTSGWKYAGSDDYNVWCYGFKRKEFVDKILGVKDTELESNE